MPPSFLHPHSLFVYRDSAVCARLLAHETPSLSFFFSFPLRPRPSTPLPPTPTDQRHRQAVVLYKARGFPLRNTRHAAQLAGPPTPPPPPLRYATLQATHSVRLPTVWCGRLGLASCHACAPYRYPQAPSMRGFDYHLTATALSYGTVPRCSSTRQRLFGTRPHWQVKAAGPHFPVHSTPLTRVSCAHELPRTRVCSSPQFTASGHTQLLNHRPSLEPPPLSAFGFLGGSCSSLTEHTLSCERVFKASVCSSPHSLHLSPLSPSQPQQKPLPLYTLRVASGGTSPTPTHARGRCSSRIHRCCGALSRHQSPYFPPRFMFCLFECHMAPTSSPPPFCATDGGTIRSLCSAPSIIYHHSPPLPLFHAQVAVQNSLMECQL